MPNTMPVIKVRTRMNASVVLWIVDLDGRWEPRREVEEGVGVGEPMLMSVGVEIGMLRDVDVLPLVL